MAQNKTQPEATDPKTFLARVPSERRREDGARLLDFFQYVTGFAPVMWGTSIIGFGRYDYVYDSGREGSFLATGFSPRKAATSIYVMPGYQDYSEILNRLGKHKIGKSCLYVTKLSDIDIDVLAELVRAGLKDLGRKWTVHPA